MILLLTFVLIGCTNSYTQLNEFVDTIPAEEEGYLFFTHHYKIDGSTKIDLEEVIADILTRNNIEYDYLSFSYILGNQLLYFNMNIKMIVIQGRLLSWIRFL